MTFTAAQETLNRMTSSEREELRSRLQAVVDHLVAREAAWNQMMDEFAASDLSD